MNNYLYSLLLQLIAVNSASIPALRGDHTHALFLDLIRQTDADLAGRLHNELEHRPFTVSLLQGATTHNTHYAIKSGQNYRLRITLLDGGKLWQRLSGHILERGDMLLHLDSAVFKLTRVLSTSNVDTNGWASFTDWQALASLSACSSIILHFASPCAFSLGKRNFALFPEPGFVWDSLARTWNRYAPAVLQMDRQAIREFVTEKVVVSDYDLHTSRVYFREYAQKGFEGTCQYHIKAEDGYAAQLATLASFARYAGVGSKTTMGMGQLKADEMGTKMVERNAAKGGTREAGLPRDAQRAFSTEQERRKTGEGVRKCDSL